MGAVKGPVLYTWEVCHPELGMVTVDAEDKGQALMRAADKWCVRWTEIAAECDVRKVGLAIKPRCRRCGKEIYTLGLCSDCAELEAMIRRDAAKIRSTDPRAEYRHRT